MIVTIGDIPAQDLDLVYGIHVINENEEIDTSVLYSPMNYCYSELNYEQNSVKALHFYNYFAVMYAGEIYGETL